MINKKQKKKRPTQPKVKARDICDVDPNQQNGDGGAHIMNVVVVDDLCPNPGSRRNSRDKSVGLVSQLSSTEESEPLGEDAWHLTNSESPEQTAEVSDRLAFGTATRSYNGTCLSFDRFETFPQWKRSLITYFSRRIAPYMLSIDDESNGWRELILPIALDDEVVMDAVITASAYHISANSDANLVLGPLSYTKAIDGLMKRQDFRSLKPLVNGFSVIAILVLLCSVLVTGCDDFPIMFKMLKSAYEVMMEDGGSGDHTLNIFLRRQVNKWVYL
ncbi:uncharacterized protein N0V89_008653 [Didymosphaeria variabile]|uniref:Uncharacterized protein n=1 Tax=Didymosphaeria variabile TaxID=1932322 RepID=A0A9W9C9H3_9PLEO|nr:uncharacterized protein N0V89_008653 [Didymosphaeria variabile]KAJ4350032.1 hypothetical protein N0V89_008653 [Didymosphaeria variabile]